MTHLRIGGLDFKPLAVPLIRKNGSWYWDIDEGKAEIRWRTTGGNKLDAIKICRGYVENTADILRDRPGRKRRPRICEQDR